MCQHLAAPNQWMPWRAPMAEMTISPEVRFVTRAGARGAGAVHFYPTRPCRSGHTSGRYVSTGKCAACVTIIRARWNAANVERKRASTWRGAQRNADRVRSGCVAWRKRNPQRAKELGVLYAERHPEARSRRSQKLDGKSRRVDARSPNYLEEGQPRGGASLRGESARARAEVGWKIFRRRRSLVV